MAAKTIKKSTVFIQKLYFIRVLQFFVSLGHIMVRMLFLCFATFVLCEKDIGLISILPSFGTINKICHSGKNPRKSLDKKLDL